VAKKIAITVHPAGTDAGSLTVADAMRQVLDLVEVLGHIDTAEGDAAEIVWRLESASTNSPFTVIAAAASPDPALSVAIEANRVASAFSDAMVGLLEDERKSEALDAEASRALERVFKRNLNGIGRTDIAVLESDAPPIHIVPLRAQRALITLERAELEEIEPNLARSEFGAREGEVVGLIRHYGKAALLVRDRITGDKVTAVLTSDLARRLGPEHKWNEAWEGERVLISGELHYDAAGTLRKIDAEEVEPIHTSPVTLAELEGIDLLRGQSPSERIDQLWGRDG
jgi:hypothetical protein